MTKKENPGAVAAARGAGNELSGSMPNATMAAPAAQRIWDACRDERAHKARKAAQIAVRMRALAKELGANSDKKYPGEWSLTCPHCSTVTYIDSKGTIYTKGRRSNCTATTKIMSFVHNALGVRS
jgi:hypothetical protein